MPRRPEPSFSLKQIVWDITATVGTENFSAIYRELEHKLRQLHKNEELYEEIPDKRTVRRIIELDIQRLSPEVVIEKLPEYVWRLRNDYEAIERLAASLKAKQEAATEAVIEQKPYKETSHKREMRNLAKDLIEETNSLSIRDSFILELAPGQLFLGKQRFPVSITEEGEIRVALSIEDEGGGDEGVLYKALRTHLETGGFKKVLADITYWSGKTADNLKNFHELFTAVRKRLEYTYHISIPLSVPIDCQGQPSFTQPGFTWYFPVLICDDAIEQASGSDYYGDLTYARDGLNLKFGVDTIYVGTSNENMQPFQDAHRKWRAKCAMWEQPKAIAKQRHDLDDITATINKQLQKFIHMERLPGHCELCS